MFISIKKIKNVFRRISQYTGTLRRKAKEEITEIKTVKENLEESIKLGVNNVVAVLNCPNSEVMRHFMEIHRYNPAVV